MIGDKLDMKRMLLSIIIIGAMMGSSFAVGMTGSNIGTEVESYDSQNTEFREITVERTTDSSEQIINTGSKAHVHVGIATTNPGKLGVLLDQMGAIHSLGKLDRELETSVIVEATVPEYAMSKLLSHEFVHDIVKLRLNEKSGDKLGFGVDKINVNNDEGIGTNSIYTTSIHDAREAWSMGYTGKDVVIGLAGEGIDFGSPDLWDTQARVTDAESPYYGWPIVYDPDSINSYLNYNTDEVQTINTVIGSVEKVGDLTYLNETTESKSSPISILNKDGSGEPEFGIFDGDLENMNDIDATFFNITEESNITDDPNDPEACYLLSIGMEIDVPPNVKSWVLKIVGYASENAEDLKITYKTDLNDTFVELPETIGLGTTSTELSIALDQERMQGISQITMYLNDTVSDKVLLPQWTWTDSGNSYELSPTNSDDSYSFNYIGLETDTDDIYELQSIWEIPLTADGREWVFNASGRVQGTSEEAFEIWYDTDRKFDEDAVHISDISGSQTTDIEYIFQLDELRNVPSLYIMLKDTERTDDLSSNSLLIEHMHVKGQALGYYVDTTRTFDVLDKFPEPAHIENEDDWANSTLYKANIPTKEQGDTETYVIEGLDVTRNYSVLVRAIDEANSYSPIGTEIFTKPVVDSVPPSPITDLVATPGLQTGEVILEWTAPGDDGMNGTAEEYKIFYSDLPITNDVCLRFNSEEAYNNIQPAAAGSSESFVVQNLDAGKNLAFMVIPVDEAGNEGGLSNSPSAVVTEDLVAPGPITDLTVEPGSNGTEIDITWTATGDDGSTGTVSEYDLRYSTLTERKDEKALRPLKSNEETLIVGEQTIQLNHGADETEYVPGPSISMTVDRNLTYNEEVHLITNEWNSAIEYQDTDSSQTHLGKDWESLYETDIIMGDVVQGSPYQGIILELNGQNIDPASFSAYHFDDAMNPIQLTESDYVLNGTTGWLMVNTEVSLDSTVSRPIIVNYSCHHWNVDPDTGSITFVNDIDDLGLKTAIIEYKYYDPTSTPTQVQLKYPNVIETSVVLDVNGLVLTEGTNFTLDYDLGLVTFADALGPLDNVTVDYTTNITINEENWNLLPRISGVPIDSAGETTYLLKKYTTGQYYSYAIKGIDENGNVGGISNVDGAFPRIDVEPPEQIIDLTVETGKDIYSLWVNWTAVGGDGNEGWAYKYELKWSFNPINDETDFANAYGYNFDNPYDVNPGTYPNTWGKPNEAGTQESYLSGILSSGMSAWGMPLAEGSHLYLALKAIDKNGNKGPMSNQADGIIGWDDTAPADVTDLAITPGEKHGTLILNWTMPGDDGMDGQTKNYRIFYSTHAFNDTSPADVIQYEGGSYKGPEGGVSHGHKVKLTSYADQEMFFRVFFRDEAIKESSTNLESAIVFNDTIAPGMITDLEVVPQEGPHAGLKITWTAPGNNDDVGKPSKYEIRYIENSKRHSYLNDYFDTVEVERKFIVFDMNGNSTENSTHFVSNYNQEEVSEDVFEVVPHSVYGVDNYSAEYIKELVHQGPYGIKTYLVEGVDYDVDLDTGKIDLYKWDVTPKNITFVGDSTFQVSYVYKLSFNVTGYESASGIVRLGTHPGENLAGLNNNRYSRVLLTDSETPGVYDTVMVDLDFDYDFSDEKKAVKGDEAIYQDADDDGVVELSGGMLYFISRSWTETGEYVLKDNVTGKITLEQGNIIEKSYKLYNNGVLVPEEENYTLDRTSGEITFDNEDLKDLVLLSNGSVEDSVLTIDYEWGIPIPSSVKYAEDNALENKIPRNGELVALMGEYDEEAVFGSIYASTIVGQGRVSHIWDSDFKGAVGIAPDAKIMTIKSYGIDGWHFAIEGYDEVTNTGDEANIFPYTGVAYDYNSGWDSTSRMLDYVFHDLGGDRTTVIASTDLPGSGYGQSSVPSAAPSVISMGMASSLYYRELERYDGGPNPCGGMLMPGSGRGPSMLGNPEPDAISVGAFAYGSQPTYMSHDPAGQLYLWNGGALSSCTGSSMLALVHQAHSENNNGTYPTSEESRKYIMSGATDLKNDVLSQGAGIVNAASSVGMAMEEKGVLVDPAYWVPGDYRGQIFDAFPRIINEDTDPDNLETNFTLKNTDDDPVTVDVEPMIYKKTGSANTWGRTDPNIDEAGYGSMGGHGWLIFNETGFYNHDGTYLSSNDAALYNSADMMKVVVTSNFTHLDENGDTKLNYSYWMELYNWTDTNDNGKADGHTFSQGAIEFFAYHERNRMAPVLPGAATTYWESIVPEPSKWFNDDGGLIWLRRLDGLPAELEFQITLEYYERDSWDWITPTKNQVTIPGNNQTEFTVYCNLPNNTPVGSYQGGVYLTYGGRTQVVPILINKATNRGSFSFGGNSTISQDLYNNTRISGDFDWRFFFMDVPDEGIYGTIQDNMKMIMDLKWGQNLTDIDLFAYGPAGADTASSNNKSRYGPTTLDLAGGSTESSLTFFTSTGGPEEVATADLASGLNVIGARCVRMNGTTPTTKLTEGKVGTMTLSTSAVSVTTNQRSSETTVSVTSNIDWDGINAIAAGPSAPQEFEEFEVLQDDPNWAAFDSFEHQLSSGQNLIYVDVSDSALILDVAISSLDTEFGMDYCPDLDLGVFLDENEDGKPQVEEFVAFDADEDAEEHVKLVQPDPGPYIIVVYGFTIPPTGLGYAHVYLTLVQGEGFSVSGTSVEPIQANTYSNIDLGWNIAGDQGTATLQGALAMGPTKAPLAMLIPVEISFQPTGYPQIVSTSLHANDVYTTDSPVLQFEFTDDNGVDPSLTQLLIDGTDVTAQCIVQSSLVKYESSGLGEGSHVANLLISDYAGNSISKHFAFEIDSKAPTLSVDNPGTIFTNNERCLVKGNTDGDSVTINYNGEDRFPELDENGAFSQELALVSPGTEKNIRIYSYDRAGNEALYSAKVVYDTQEPVFEGNRVKVDVSSVTNKKSMRVFGSVDPIETNEKGSVYLAVNGVKKSMMYDGTFDIKVDLVKEGVNNIEVKIWDEAGNVNTQNIQIIRDTTPPEIVVVTPVNAQAEETTYTITGYVKNTEKSSILINGERVGLDTSGWFNKTYLVNPGTSYFVISAEDDVGNVAEERITVTQGFSYETNSPTVADEPISSSISPLAIILMVVLLIAGLILGAVAGFFGAGFTGEDEEEPDEDEDFGEDEMTGEEEVPEEFEPETIEEAPEPEAGEETAEEDIVNEDDVPPAPPAPPE